MLLFSLNLSLGNTGCSYSVHFHLYCSLVSVYITNKSRFQIKIETTYRLLAIRVKMVEKPPSLYIVREVTIKNGTYLQFISFSHIKHLCLDNTSISRNPAEIPLNHDQFKILWLFLKTIFTFYYILCFFKLFNFQNSRLRDMKL